MWMPAPGSRIGPVNAEERKALMQHSLVAGVYEKTVDRESAYELLKGRAQHRQHGGPRNHPRCAGQPARRAQALRRPRPSGAGMRPAPAIGARDSCSVAPRAKAARA
ncbi:MAG: helicase HerA-like domain-containing protein [Thiomonas sp.]